MKITISIILAFCLCTFSASAQDKYAIKGTITDTSSVRTLTNATISVLNAKDSILQKYTYAVADGAFSIKDLSAGKFLLLVTYPDYVDYVESFTLDAEHPAHDFSSLNMQLKSKFLAAIMIKGEINAIKIKGDTTEFNPKAYHIKPNDKVEDLLKQLPGMTVDKDGKITANGVKVGKVLVDGEEFFGDDPTLVTQNLRADMVASVQLYDKKSDQAAFTGIDDGEKTRTINIKLKEDKKNGVFGKVAGGIGVPGFYEGQTLFNKFKAKYKFSLYGTAANTGKVGLNEDDAGKLGTSNIVQIGDDIYRSGSDDQGGYDGQYYGNGLPVAKNGGVHYDTKFGKDNAGSVNTNYKLGSMDVTGLTTTSSQQDLTSGIINNNSRQNYSNSAFRQKLDAAYQLKIDTSGNLKIGVDGTLRNSKTYNNTASSSDNGNNILLNRSNRTNTNDVDQKNVNASLFYSKKLKKPGRTFSFNLSESYNENQGKGYLNSATDFFNKSGALDSTEYVDQLKTTYSKRSVLNTNLTYSEPLSKYFAIVINYAVGINNNHSDSKSFDKSKITSRYDSLNTAFSNNYQFNQLTNQAGAIFNYKKDKTLINFGTKTSAIDFKQVDVNSGAMLKRSFINWTPQASYFYKFSLQRSLSINYYGNTSQPNIDQIQPLRVNTNPLYITLGNPDLKASFSNRYSIYYNSYGIISGRSIYLSTSYNYTTSAIINSSVTDVNTGKTTSQSVNLASKTPYSYYVNANFNQKIKPVDISVGISGNVNTYISYAYINNALNQTASNSYTGRLSLSKYVENKFDFYISAGPGYSVNKSSLQEANNNNAATFNSYADGSVYLPASFSISANMQYTYKAKTRSFDAQRNTIINASINKTFFKGKNLKFSLMANNILDQNNNDYRSANGTTITQTSNTGIRRYFMFTVSWDFTKFGTIPAKN